MGAGLTFKQSTERSRSVLKMLLTEKYTMREVGEHFGITKQRVSQMYYKEFGKMYLPRKKEITEKKHQMFLNTISYYCEACHTAVYERDKREIDGHHKGPFSKYCRTCSEISMGEHRDPKKICICKQCGIPFYPHYTKAALNAFHNRSCASFWMAKNYPRDEKGQLRKLTERERYDFHNLLRQ